MTRPNSVTTTYGYDSLSRLLSVLHKAGTTTIDGATYTVDNAGNRTAKTDQRTAVATSYGYDNIYQLLSATQGGAATETYTYDGVGNRLSALTGSYGYNNSNEMNSAPGATYTYDNNGNTQTKVDSTGTTNYTWDYENRLTSVMLPGSGGTVSFKYDPFGRRIYKSSSAGSSIFAYDGDNITEETNSSGAVVARYSQGLNVDEPLAMLRSGATSYYNADGLGSVTSLANASGTLAQTYTFDSFGKQTASSGSLINPFQYTARELDSETGLYYYRARYYVPATGRFLSEDPIGFDASTNFYAYVGNGPLGAIDPSGLTITVVGDRQSLDQALAYLRRDPRMAAVIASLEDPDVDLTVITNSLGLDSTHPIFHTDGIPIFAKGGTILWDPNSGLGCDDTGGSQQSPALGLAHELIHASHPVWLRVARNLVIGGEYTNLEEQVTINAENEVARHLGEGIRQNHGGRSIKVKGPLAKPTDCGCSGSRAAPTL